MELAFFVEIIVFIASAIITGVFLWRWYKLQSKDCLPDRLTKYVFGFLPLEVVAIIVLTLTVLASFDVVNNIFYILFYILLGFVWLYAGLTLMSACFDLSWIDDVLNLNNRAALFTVTGGALGVTLIYSGANIGDGPGWWCVIFAGGLGLITWLLLGFFMNKTVNACERVTVDRDLTCGIRHGCFLAALGIILAKACSGDWTSFSMTVIEFLDGWPVIPLTLLAFAVEKIYIKKGIKDYRVSGEKGVFIAVVTGELYIAAAILCVLFIPSIVGYII